jgi:hypothetical protein
MLRCGYHPPAMKGFDGESAFRLRWETQPGDTRQAVAWNLRHSRRLRMLQLSYGVAAVLLGLGGWRTATGGGLWTWTAGQPAWSRSAHWPWRRRCRRGCVGLPGGPPRTPQGTARLRRRAAAAPRCDPVAPALVGVHRDGRDSPAAAAEVGSASAGLCVPQARAWRPGSRSPPLGVSCRPGGSPHDACGRRGSTAQRLIWALIRFVAPVGRHVHHREQHRPRRRPPPPTGAGLSLHSIEASCGVASQERCKRLGT